MKIMSERLPDLQALYMKELRVRHFAHALGHEADAELLNETIQTGKSR